MTELYNGAVLLKMECVTLPEGSKIARYHLTVIQDGFCQVQQLLQQ
jgi:hypothetical protein